MVEDILRTYVMHAADKPPRTSRWPAGHPLIGVYHQNLVQRTPSTSTRCDLSTRNNSYFQSNKTIKVILSAIDRKHTFYVDSNRRKPLLLEHSCPTSNNSHSNGSSIKFTVVQFSLKSRTCAFNCRFSDTVATTSLHTHCGILTVMFVSQWHLPSSSSRDVMLSCAYAVVAIRARTRYIALGSILAGLNVAMNV